MGMSNRHAALFAFVVGSSSSLLGCIGDNETVVFVEPTVETPAAAIAGSVLGVTVTGSFKLHLVLGPRASGPSTVQLGSFALTDALNQTSLVPSLSLVTKSTLPIVLALDSETTVDFTFDIGDKTVPTETQTALCLPAGVRIAGTILDSLETGASPVASAVFSPTGCM